MSELVFFDVDGTLSAPCYPRNGIFGPGMPGEEWIRFCVTHGPEAYQWCAPVPQVKAYAEKRKAQGARLYVLTTSQTSFESAAKERFIALHYPGLFEDVIAVAGDSLKQQVILQMAADAQVPLSDCELVEDTYMTLLHVQALGMKATHISNILAECWRK